MAALVATLSQLAPGELRDVYQQAVPMLQKYDAFLGDVQSALANDRDLTPSSPMSSLAPAG
jgi:hypothetical protein